MQRTCRHAWRAMIIIIRTPPKILLCHWRRWLLLLLHTANSRHAMASEMGNISLLEFLIVIFWSEKQMFELNERRKKVDVSEGAFPLRSFYQPCHRENHLYLLFEFERRPRRGRRRKEATNEQNTRARPTMWHRKRQHHNWWRATTMKRRDGGENPSAPPLFICDY